MALSAMVASPYMPTKEERDLKRLEKLQAEQKQLQAQLKQEKQTAPGSTERKTAAEKK